MRSGSIIAGATLAASLAACATGRTDQPAAADPAPEAVATQLRDAGGRTVASASANQMADALRVRVEASGLAAGIYGIHIHAVGRCDAPGFETAGPHWNPSDREHGRDNMRGQHAGDLPNLLVGTDGRGSFEFTIPSAGLSQGGRRLMDADGASIVLHARADDYRTDPSGNSGARIACGVLS
ncbi:MAG TPA: superoxide dismutase family protein [Allosphingosinicella sp.]|nr:superoxide dismutase family protein [Allosphingosinicella sp.]